MCPFLTYQYFLEIFCSQVILLEKVPNFATLGEIVFGKPLGFNSKLCNYLFAALCRKGEIKGLFLKF